MCDYLIYIICEYFVLFARFNKVSAEISVLNKDFH